MQLTTPSLPVLAKACNNTDIAHICPCILLSFHSCKAQTPHSKKHLLLIALLLIHIRPLLLSCLILELS